MKLLPKFFPGRREQIVSKIAELIGEIRVSDGNPHALDIFERIVRYSKRWAIALREAGYHHSFNMLEQEARESVERFRVLCFDTPHIVEVK